MQPESVAIDLRYDYDQIDEAHRSEVRAAAIAIKQSAQIAQENILTIGQRLLEIKAFLPHGQFGKWLAVEFDLSERMAQRMMSAAKVYGANPTHVSLFSASTLYLLAEPSTPAEARSAVEAEAEATGKPPTRARTLAIIQEHKPSMTLDETIAFVWHLVKRHTSFDKAVPLDSLRARLNWLAHPTVDFYVEAQRDGVELKPEVLREALKRVTAEVQETIARIQRKYDKQMDSSVRLHSGAASAVYPSSTAPAASDRQVRLHALRRIYQAALEAIGALEESTDCYTLRYPLERGLRSALEAIEKNLKASDKGR